MLKSVKATRIIRDAGSSGKSRESSPMIRHATGGRPAFQRALIWSITSIKYLYNHLVTRNGDIQALIAINQADENSLFRCLDMDRLSYPELDEYYHHLIQDYNQLDSEAAIVKEINSSLPLNSAIVQSENGEVV